MRRRFAFLIAALTFASSAHAQPQQGAIVSGVVGAAAVQSSTDVVIAVAAGYRFNRVFGLGLELTAVPSLSIDPIFQRFRGIDFDDVSGSLTVFTTNIRLEVPTTSPRIVPYAVAGGGVANVTEGFGAVIAYDGPATTSLQLAPVPTIFPPPQPYLFSTTNLALTAGGGVSILAGGHLSVDVDLRYLRLMGDQDRNIGRFGAGVSYRF